MKVGRRSARAWLSIVAVGLAIALVPTSASAWYEKLHGFTDGTRVGVGVKLKKCQGGKLGDYKLFSSAYVGLEEGDLFQVLTATFSVRDRWRPLRDIRFEIEAPANFDPAVTAEILNAYGSFYDSIETRWSPGEIEIRHGELSVFGAQILSSGVHKENFKPKPTCPAFP